MSAVKKKGEAKVEITAESGWGGVIEARGEKGCADVGQQEEISVTNGVSNWKKKDRKAQAGRHKENCKIYLDNALKGQRGLGDERRSKNRGRAREDGRTDPHENAEKRLLDQGNLALKNGLSEEKKERGKTERKEHGKA